MVCIFPMPGRALGRDPGFNHLLFARSNQNHLRDSVLDTNGNGLYKSNLDRAIEKSEKTHKATKTWVWVSVLEIYDGLKEACFQGNPPLFVPNAATECKGSPKVSASAGHQYPSSASTKKVSSRHVKAESRFDLKSEVKSSASHGSVGRENAIEEENGNIPMTEEVKAAFASTEAALAAAEASANQRERLTMSTKRLNQSTDRIKESRRAALETEELRVSILEDLQQQRKTLLHSHKKAHVTPLQEFFMTVILFFVKSIFGTQNMLYDVDDAIDKSKKMLTSMSRRISRNKWIVGSIIAALILAIVIVMYFKKFH